MERRVTGITTRMFPPSVDSGAGRQVSLAQVGVIVRSRSLSQRSVEDALDDCRVAPRCRVVIANSAITAVVVVTIRGGLHKNLVKDVVTARRPRSSSWRAEAKASRMVNMVTTTAIRNTSTLLSALIGELLPKAVRCLMCLSLLGCLYHLLTCLVKLFFVFCYNVCVWRGRIVA